MRQAYGRVNDFVADQQKRMRSSYDVVSENLRRCAVRRKKTLLEGEEIGYPARCFGVVLLPAPLYWQTAKVGD